MVVRARLGRSSPGPPRAAGTCPSSAHKNDPGSPSLHIGFLWWGGRLYRRGGKTSTAGSSTRTRATRFPSADPARRATRACAASPAQPLLYRARSATGAGASPWAACVRISESRSDEKHCFLPRLRQGRPQLPRAAGPRPRTPRTNARARPCAPTCAASPRG